MQLEGWTIKLMNSHESLILPWGGDPEEPQGARPELIAAFGTAMGLDFFMMFAEKVFDSSSVPNERRVDGSD
jgi:hypothetical protein